MIFDHTINMNWSPLHNTLFEMSEREDECVRFILRATRNKVDGLRGNPTLFPNLAKENRYKNGTWYR